MLEGRKADAERRVILREGNLGVVPRTWELDGETLTPWTGCLLLV